MGWNTTTQERAIEMRIMVIDKANGWIRIKVDELPEQRYLWFSEREAIKKYREKYNLIGKHISRFYR